MKIKNIIFDLDGTLLNQSEGIYNSIRYAMSEVGVEIDPDFDLSVFIGPPLVKSFQKYFDYDEEGAKARIKDYRQYFFDKGKDQYFLYPGVVEMIKDLSDKLNIYIGTTKLHESALEVLEKEDIIQYIDGVQGSNDKIALKTDIISQLVKDYDLNPEETIMVGDHRLDIDGARDNNMRVIACRYGFGDRDETSHADYCVDSVEELHETLRGLL